MSEHNTGCRIGKVTLKNNIVVYRGREKSYFDRAVGELVNNIDRDTDCIGWFCVQKNGLTKTGFYYAKGSSDCHLLGGVDLLRCDIIKCEGILE